MNERKPFRPLDGVAATDRYVAFVDILGFGRRVLEEFDLVLEVYRELLDRHPILLERNKGVSVRILSDAFVVTSETFDALVPVIQGLHMISLLQDCLVRGGVGFGKHLEASSEGHFIVVSQALVRAVTVEKRIRHPCVALDDTVQIHDDYLNGRFSPVQRGVLRFDGIRMICPFNVLWGHSAVTRVAMLYEQHPEYAEKYDWFLRLYDAFHHGDPLVK